MIRLFAFGDVDQTSTKYKIHKDLSLLLLAHHYYNNINNNVYIFHQARQAPSWPWKARRLARPVPNNIRISIKKKTLCMYSAADGLMKF